MDFPQFSLPFSVVSFQPEPREDSLPDITFSDLWSSKCGHTEKFRVAKVSMDVFLSALVSNPTHIS